MYEIYIFMYALNMYYFVYQVDDDDTSNKSMIIFLVRDQRRQKSIGMFIQQGNFLMNEFK